MTDKENNFAKDINVPHKHKPIYLDGVDVNKCEYFKDGMCYAECDLEGYTDWECKDAKLSNCYFKQLARKTQELKSLKNNEDLLISNLQILWGKQIAKEQGDCKNIDYSKPRTREIYLKISEIEQTLKDVAFAQSVNIGKTKPLGDTGSPKSYRNWERKEKKLLERVFLE